MWKLISGIMNIISIAIEALDRERLINTGRKLQKGTQDEATLAAVERANKARQSADHKQLDDELRLD